MAFTGSATIVKVSDRMYRITGLTLATQGAAGTIGLSGGTGDVDLPEPTWGPYLGINSVTLISAVKCTINLVGAAVVAPAVQVVKTGTTVADFLITLTNLGAASTTEMEIWVEFH